jgi:hypothetical protein
VTGAVFLGRTNIEYRDLSFADATQELGTVHGLHRASLFQEIPRDLFDFREPCFGQHLKRVEETPDSIVGQAILDMETFFLSVDQASGP